MTIARGAKTARYEICLTAAAVAAAALSACGHAGAPQQCVPVTAAPVAAAPVEAAPPPPPPPAVSAPPARPAVDPAQVVARVGDSVITVRDVQERINKQSPFVRARYTSLEKKKEFLDSLIRFEVMAQEAARLGYDQDPEVLRVMKQQMISKFMQNEIESKLSVEAVPAADVERYYAEHPAEFDRRPLSEVRRQIQQRLFRDLRTKAMDEVIDDLRRRTRIEVRAENLGKVVIETDPPKN
jgi:hypothetical protein